VKASLLSEVKNGDIVKIETSEKLQTRCSWIDTVKTSKAQTNMRINCNARLRDIDTKTGVNIVATAMSLNPSRVEEWFIKREKETIARIPYDIDYYRKVITEYKKEISQNNRFQSFLSRHKFKVKSTVLSGIEIFSTTNVNHVVFDYCCHPKAGDQIIAFLDKNKVHVHHKMCKSAAKFLDTKEKMIFVRWERKSLYNYKLIGSLHNEKGALAKFLTYLAKLEIDISSIELGKNSVEYTKYCEIEFESKDENMNLLRAKIENNIKVIHLIRTDDAYK